MNIINKQQGHAAILFSMMIPVLFGVFMLGSDGARAVQDKARLNEALEVASLAVSAQASSNSSTRISTAVNYVKYYFPLANVSAEDINVSVTTCDPFSTVDGCSSTSEDRYFNYEVTGTITQDSWFPGNDVIAGFGDEYDVGSYSSSRKYQSEAIDVMLVADFSASMYEDWDGDTERKFVSVINILGDIADVLEDYNDTITDGYELSTIGVAGYDFYTRNDDDDFVADIQCSEYVQYTSNKNGKGGSWSIEDSPDGRCYSSEPEHPAYNTLDVTSTINKVFDTTDVIHSSGWSDSEVTNISTFTNVALTSDIDTFKSEINNSSNFNITKGSGSGTFSPAGVIKGAQLLDQGTNEKKLLIVLSDGGDSYTSYDDNFSDQLYGNDTYTGGLCDTIREHFTDSDIDITMAVIGFDYEIDDYPQLANCVGDDNVYEAENSEEIEDTILSLITEEIGHLATGTE